MVSIAKYIAVFLEKLFEHAHKNAEKTKTTTKIRVEIIILFL